MSHLSICCWHETCWRIITFLLNEPLSWLTANHRPQEICLKLGAKWLKIMDVDFIFDWIGESPAFIYKALRSHFTKKRPQNALCPFNIGLDGGERSSWSAPTWQNQDKLGPFFGLEKRLQLGSHQLGNCDFALPSFNLKYLFCFVLFCFKIISFYEIIWSNPDSSGRIFEAKQRGEWKRKKPSFARTKRGRFAANFPKGGGGNYTFHLFVCFPRFLPAFCHYKTLMNTQRFYS